MSTGPERNGNLTDDEEKSHNIPTSIDDIHTPANGRKTDRHDVNENKTSMISVQVWPDIELLCDLRRNGIAILLDSVPVGPDGIVEDLGRI